MVEYSERNLCVTLEVSPRYVLLPCIPRPKGLSFPHDKDSEYDRRHAWDGGTLCAHCGRTLSEVRVRVNPKTGAPVRRGTLARDIALTMADVPPVRFHSI